jgi:small conductance mechanosensitive channel
VQTSGLRLIGILIGAIVLIWLLKIFTRRLVKLASSESRTAVMREQQTRTLAGILYSAGMAAIAFTAVMVALPEFGINITPIAAAAGLASLALGFGAQHLVRDLINGFFIVFEDQYVVGDLVRVNQVTGRVEHITLRRTVVRDFSGGLVTIPNGEIRQVANISRDWSQIFVDVTIAAEADANQALEAIERTAAEMRADSAWAAVLVDGPRVLGVESLGPGGTVVRVQVRTSPTRQDDVARELRRRVKVQLDKEEIQCVSTQRVELAREE